MIRSLCGCTLAAALLFFAAMLFGIKDPWTCLETFMALAILVLLGSAVLAILAGSRCR